MVGGCEVGKTPDRTPDVLSIRSETSTVGTIGACGEIVEMVSVADSTMGVMSVKTGDTLIPVINCRLSSSILFSEKLAKLVRGVSVLCLSGSSLGSALSSGSGSGSGSSLG